MSDGTGTVIGIGRDELSVKNDIREGGLAFLSYLFFPQNDFLSLYRRGTGFEKGLSVKK